MDRQFGKAQANREVGDDYFEENDICLASWFYLRALFDICPWLPSEWYMSEQEGQLLLMGKDLVGHCCNRIAYFAWKSNRDDLAIIAADFAADHSFASHRTVFVAHELSKFSRQYAETRCFTRTANWYQMMGTEPVDQGIWSSGPYRNVGYCLSDVCHWARTLHLGGNKSKLWDFDQFDLSTFISDAKFKWRSKYGIERKPYHWDGTEDETLGLELGKDPVEDIKEYINTPIRTPRRRGCTNVML